MDDFYVLHVKKEQNFVDVETAHGPLKGYLHVIDPESGNIVVQSNNTLVVLSHTAITSIKLSENGAEQLPPSKLLEPFDRQRTSKESLSCNHLIQEFRKRLIDAQVVVKDGEKQISLFDGTAWIIPPYDLSSSYSENETVLARLRHILSDIMEM